MNQLLGKLYVVATPIGNLGDLSLRAKEVLSQVTWIAAEDTRHSSGLLQHLGIHTPLISYHEHNERERAVQLVQKCLEGESGALISDAGTPLISDPGYWMVATAHAMGVPVVPIPGPCAVIAALSVSGLPTDKFLFEGFLPHKGQPRVERLKTLSTFAHTVVLFESPHRIQTLLEEIVQTMGPERRVLLAREITKRFESILLKNAQTLLNELISGEIPSKGEFIIVIEGFKEDKESTDQEKEIHRILEVLLPEMPVKQAVQIAVKLTGFAKNVVYDTAIKMKD